MEVVHQSPEFRIEIVRPNFALMANSAAFRESCETIATFYPTYTMEPGNVRSNAITAYNFGESIRSVESPFSITLVAEGDAPREGRTSISSKNATWFERVRPFDIVYIEEWNEIRYIGIVHDIELSGSMGGGARTITVTGNGIGQLLSSFKFIIDTFIYGQSTVAAAALEKLQGDLALVQNAGAPISDLIRTLYNGWMDAMMNLSGEIGTAHLGIRSIIDALMDLNTSVSTDMKTTFPLTTSLFQVGENCFWDIIQRLAPPPLYEVFGRTTPQGKYEIVIRETPFSIGVGQSWDALNKVTVPLYYTTAYSFRVSDREVFTFYMAYISDSLYSGNEVMLMSADLGGDISVAIPQIDAEKWKKYGYRPLMCSFKYYSRDKDSDPSVNSNAKAALAQMSARLRTWYQNSDCLLTGSVSMMTMKDNNPRAGERISYGGLDFYVEDSSHGWQYGGAMTTRLTLSRGADYANGAPTNYEDIVRNQQALGARLEAEARSARNEQIRSRRDAINKKLGVRDLTPQ